MIQGVALSLCALALLLLAGASEGASFGGVRRQSLPDAPLMTLRGGSTDPPKKAKKKKRKKKPTQEEALEEEKKVIREALREKDAETALGDAIR